jgi:hypothetical protein
MRFVREQAASPAAPASPVVLGRGRTDVAAAPGGERPAHAGRVQAPQAVRDHGASWARSSSKSTQRVSPVKPGLNFTTGDSIDLK